MSDTNENITNEEISEAATTESEKDLSQNEAPSEEKEPVTASEAPQKKKSKTLIIATLCALIAIVAGALVFTLGSGYDKTFDPLFYIGSDGIYMKDLGTGKKEAVKILEIKGEETYISNILLNSDLTEALLGVEEETGTSVYSYKLQDAASAAVKIAEGVNSFTKNEATGIITCSIGETSKLVQFDAELKETVIAENVDNYEISADGSSLFYTVKDGGTFLIQNGNKAVELSKNGSVEFSDEAHSIFYILEEGSLYKVTATGEKTLIDKDVASTVFADTDGYYYKTVKTINIKDLFEDDMAESDNEIKIPTDTDSEAYQLYTERLTRDQIRTVIINPEINYLVQDLYYFDGTENKNVLKNVYGNELAYYFSDPVSTEAANLNCSVFDTDNIKKVRMSELWSIFSDPETTPIGGAEAAAELIAEPLIESCTDYFVYKGEFAAKLNFEGVIHDCTFDEKNNTLYVTVSEDVFGEAALYKMPVTETGLGEAELVCGRVNSLETTVSENGKLYYIEETYIDESSLDAVSKVYYDSKLIADNVYNVIERNLENGLFIFEKYTENEDGTLNFEDYIFETVIYDDKTGTTLTFDSAKTSDYYYEFIYTPAGKTLISESDYELTDSLSNLYAFDNGKQQTVYSMPRPEYFNFMSEVLAGTGYFDWEGDGFWDDESFSDAFLPQDIIL